MIMKTNRYLLLLLVVITFVGGTALGAMAPEGKTKDAKAEAKGGVAGSAEPSGDMKPCPLGPVKEHCQEANKGAGSHEGCCNQAAGCRVVRVGNCDEGAGCRSACGGTTGCRVVRAGGCGEGAGCRSACGESTGCRVVVAEECDELGLDDCFNPCVRVSDCGMEIPV